MKQEGWDGDSDKRDISAVIYDRTLIVSKVMYLIGPTSTADAPIRNVVPRKPENTRAYFNISVSFISGKSHQDIYLFGSDMVY